MCILQQSSSRLVHHNNNTLICSPDLLLTVLDISQELCHSVFTIWFLIYMHKLWNKYRYPTAISQQQDREKGFYHLEWYSSHYQRKTSQNCTHSLSFIVFLLFIFHLYSFNAHCWMFKDHSESIHIHQCHSVSSLFQVLWLMISWLFSSLEEHQHAFLLY